MTRADAEAGDLLDVVVRFHDVSRLAALDQAIFSLAMQRYRPLRIHLCVQRFTEAALAETRARLAPILAIAGAPPLDIHNWTEAAPRDARSMLVNLGIRHARGRYLAFLDYDDVLYPEAYALLVDRLRATDAAIAFCRICLKTFANYRAFDYAMSKGYPFSGVSAIELLAANFCPVHSFVVDRQRHPEHNLFFDPVLNKNEDYDFLIRAVAAAPADFGLIDTILGEYFIKSDGSNTILTEYAATPETVRAWADAEAFVEARRRTVLVAPAVQRSLGIAAPVPGLTVRGLIERRDELLGGTVASLSPEA